MIAKIIICITLLSTCSLIANSIEHELENEVHEFVQNAINGEGIIDYFNRKESDRKIKNPRDWEAVLSKMLDIEKYSEMQMETVAHIIQYRESSDDPRVRKAIINMIDQLHANASEENYKLSQGEAIETINRHKSHTSRLNSYVSRFATHKNVPLLQEELMSYALSWKEDKILALTDSTYARMFLSTNGVETPRHGDLLEKLIPKLKKRGLKDKTIELAEKTLRDIRRIHPAGSNKSISGRRRYPNVETTTQSDLTKRAYSKGSSKDEKSPSFWIYGLSAVFCFVGIFLVLRNQRKKDDSRN